MEDETLASLRYCFQRILVPSIVIVGLLGNFVTVIVLTRRRMRCSTNVYLFFLAIVDMVFLLFNFILSFQHYPHLNRSKYELYWRLYGIFIWLVDGSSYSSIYLTVSFTIERYIAVCHPIRGQALCTESRAKKVIAVVIVMCFLLTSTTSFEHMLNSYEKFTDSRTGKPCQPPPVNGSNVNPEWNSSAPFYGLPTMLPLLGDYNASALGGEKGLIISMQGRNVTSEPDYCIKEVFLKAVPSELGMNETYQTIVTYTAAVLFTFLPLILLATFNCFLIAAVHNSTKLRRNMTNSRKSHAAAVQENKMTVTLIAVVVLFLVCQTPTAIFLLYSSFVGEPLNRLEANLRLAIGNILNYLVIINAACNFILYCALSAKYRETVKDIIFRRGQLNRQNTQHTRASRYVSRADGNGNRSTASVGRSSRTPSFQADFRQKMNSSSRSSSFNNNNISSGGGRRPTMTGSGVGGQSGDQNRNRTSSISDGRPSINASGIGSNCLTESNRSGAGDDNVNRKQSTSSSSRLTVPQSSSAAHRRDSTGAAAAAASSPLLEVSLKKADSMKKAEHLLRSSQSSASLTRSQSLMFPEQTKHSPNCKSHPLNK